jgi:predicted enzyme related to lactoylglutathione lyase
VLGRHLAARCRAAQFYTQLFGWTAEADSPARFIMCALRGRDVAAVGVPLLEGAPPAPDDEVMGNKKRREE